MLLNLTTKEILLDHQPDGVLPVCGATRLNYFYSTRSFVNTYEELVNLIGQRFDFDEITFKASRDKGYFLEFEELKEKTIAALMQVMIRKHNLKQYTLLFNKMHNIGKILFTPSQERK